MYYIFEKQYRLVYDPESDHWKDFDQLGSIKPYTSWITVTEKRHKMMRGQVVGADVIIKILLDKGETLQVLKGGMQEKRDAIKELNERVQSLTNVNLDLLRMLKESGVDVQTTV